MKSPLMEYLGIAFIDIAWIFIALFVLSGIMIILFIVMIAKYNSLKKRYEKFMKGKDAKSLEKDIIALFENNKSIEEENEENRKTLRKLMKVQESCFQKIGIVKYDAFNQMGGKLSFCLCILNNDNTGFILNSVHSSGSCYIYTKEIVGGNCELSLGEEERKALDIAMGE